MIYGCASARAHRLAFRHKIASISEESDKKNYRTTFCYLILADYDHLIPMRSLYFFLFILAIDFCDAVSWLAIGLPSSRTENARRIECRKLKGLTKRQIRFCRQNNQVMESVRMGAYTAYSECQFQFKQRRWNCSLIDPITRELVGAVLLNEVNRESAFVHAISAAGVAYRVTRDCARGVNGDSCGCDITKKQGDDFMGCSDNVQYGIAISREFVDAAEKTKNGSVQAALINLHNNRAGREVLEKSLRKECKCHGVSGSCDVRTCWHALPTFQEIGHQLKERFDGASEVTLVREKETQTPRLVMKHTQFKRHTPSDLVYMVQSPDYCDPDPSRGIFGTRGRECNATSSGNDGCQLLCCNRGSFKQTYTFKKDCNCKFHYCCRVECDICEFQQEHHFCL